MPRLKEVGSRYSKPIPVYVVLFSIYPVLALLANNIDQVLPSAAVLPLAVSIAGAGILLLFFWILWRDVERASFATFILLVLSLSYGHVYSYLKGITVFGTYIFRHRTLAPFWLIMAGLGIWWARGKKLNVQNYTRILNIVCAILLVLPLIQMSSSLWKQWKAWERPTKGVTAVETAPGEGKTEKVLPDIYYIILDAYSRTDILKKIYGYDNTEFLTSLEGMGFYVVDCSQSNYGQTELSLASSLNFNYLSKLGDSFTPTSLDRAPLWPLIKDSAVMQYLKGLGYKVVAFKTGFSWTELTDADIYLAPQLIKWQINEFQYMWLQTTIGRVLLDEEALKMLGNPDALFRQRTEFALEKLRVLPSIGGPKFVFAHLIIPHPPFVFGPNGEEVSSGSGVTTGLAGQGYVDQTIFIDKQLEDIVPTIIANSSNPPIIIIQSDHGTGAAGGADHMANLSALYLPGHEGLLYPTMTNVNTFRVILDEYFGQTLPLLPDVSFFSNYTLPYNFHVVVNNCPQ